MGINNESSSHSVFELFRHMNSLYLLFTDIHHTMASLMNAAHENIRNIHKLSIIIFLITLLRT